MSREHQKNDIDPTNADVILNMPGAPVPFRIVKAGLTIEAAEETFQCDRCQATIPKGAAYHRTEPGFIAKHVKRARPERLCWQCGYRVDHDSGWGLLAEISQATRSEDYIAVMRAIAEEEAEEEAAKKAIVHIADVTGDLVALLLADPEEIYRITPETFELLICDRFDEMGFSVKQVGHTFQQDGGIDIIAWKEDTPFPFLLAVQAKHHRSPEYKTTPREVREMKGTLRPPFAGGVIVTNTTFTPSAKWFAEQEPVLVTLRDITHIRRWLINDFLGEEEHREMPSKIEVCPGITIIISEPPIIKPKS